MWLESLTRVVFVVSSLGVKLEASWPDQPIIGYKGASLSLSDWVTMRSPSPVKNLTMERDPVPDVVGLRVGEEVQLELRITRSSESYSRDLRNVTDAPVLLRTREEVARNGPLIPPSIQLQQSCFNSLTPPNQLEFRDLFEGGIEKDSSSQSSSDEVFWVPNPNKLGGESSWPVSCAREAKTTDAVVEVYSSDGSSISGPSDGPCNQFEEVSSAVTISKFLERSNQPPRPSGADKGCLFPETSHQAEGPSSIQTTRKLSEGRSGRRQSDCENASEPVPDLGENDINEAVDRLLAGCQRQADLSNRSCCLPSSSDARGGLCPERSLSRGGPLSHGAAPAERAAAEAGAKTARLGSQETGLLALIHEVFKCLPRLLKAKKSTAVRDAAMEGVFPLPLPRVRLGYGCEVLERWEEGAIRGLNWLVCQSFRLGDGPPNSRQAMLLDGIHKGLVLLEGWKGLDVTSFNPQDLFRQRWINSYGEEVHVAQSVRWENIRDSLPQNGVAGVVPACEIVAKS